MTFTDRRPNSAPAYYQGRPAALVIAALRSRRRRMTSAAAPVGLGGRDGDTTASFGKRLSAERPGASLPRTLLRRGAVTDAA